MPIYKTLTVNEFTKVYLWKIEESEEELAQNIELTSHCANRMLKMKSEMHRRGFLSIRHLMAIAGYVDADLYYDENGKPHLKDGSYISITHSNHFTGIIVSNSKEVGIDIEMQRDKILRIAHKFTPISEYKTIANSDALVRKLTQVWCAKESLYKIYSTPGVSFINHIMVDDFRLEDKETTASIFYEGKASNYTVAFEEFEGFTFAYALKELL